MWHKGCSFKWWISVEGDGANIGEMPISTWEVVFIEIKCQNTNGQALKTSWT